MLPATSRKIWFEILLSTMAAVVATLLAALATAFLGRNPLIVISGLLEGATGNAYRLADALGQSCPLILCGLAVAIAFRCRAWNIGVEGQYLAGAIVTATLGVTCNTWPGWLLLPSMLLLAAAAGAVYALPPVLLENRRNVPLVLSTILLNFVAVSLVAYLTQGPLRGSDPSAAQSDRIAPQAFIRHIIPATDLHWGFVIALLAAVGLWFMMRWGTPGFTIRAAGLNPVAAQWSGIRVDRTRLGVMCLSGALGGLAGGIQVAGINRVLNIQASEEFGYVGIAVALLGRLNPIGVVFAAVFIGFLDVAALHLERQPDLDIPSDLGQVIKGLLVLVLLIMSGPRVRRWFGRRGWQP